MKPLQLTACAMATAAFEDTQLTESQAAGRAAQQACLKCGEGTSLDSGAVQRGSTGMVCKPCTNLYQVLYRHIGGLPAQFTGMPVEAQRNFFLTSGKALASCPRNSRWSMVKANVVKSYTTFKTEQMKRTVTKDFLPLSVWKQQGFDTDDIQARGERMDDDVSGRQCFVQEAVCPLFLLTSGVSAHVLLIFSDWFIMSKYISTSQFICICTKILS